MSHGIRADGSEFVDLELVTGSGAEVVPTHGNTGHAALLTTRAFGTILRVGDQHVPVINLQVRYDLHEYVVIHCRLPAPLWRIDCVSQQEPA